MTGQRVILRFNEIRTSKGTLRKDHCSSSTSPLIQDYSRNFSRRSLPVLLATSSPWHAIKDLRNSHTFTQNYSAVCIITPDTCIRDTWRFFEIAYQVPLILISRREAVRRKVYVSDINWLKTIVLYPRIPVSQPEAFHASGCNCDYSRPILRVLIIHLISWRRRRNPGQISTALPHNLLRV